MPDTESVTIIDPVPTVVKKIELNIKGNLGIGIIYFPINTNIQLTIGD